LDCRTPDLSTAIAELCEDQNNRNEILNRTMTRVESMTEDNLAWCHQRMGSLRKVMVAEKLYPPGRIIHVGILDDNKVNVREVKQEFFRDLKLHPRMLDLSRHIPHRYEAVLSKLWNSVNDTLKI